MSNRLKVETVDSRFANMFSACHFTIVRKLAVSEHKCSCIMLHRMSQDHEKYVYQIVHVQRRKCLHMPSCTLCCTDLATKCNQSWVKTEWKHLVWLQLRMTQKTRHQPKRNRGPAPTRNERGGLAESIGINKQEQTQNSTEHKLIYIYIYIHKSK